MGESSNKRLFLFLYGINLVFFLAKGLFIAYPYERAYLGGFAILAFSLVACLLKKHDFEFFANTSGAVYATTAISLMNMQIIPVSLNWTNVLYVIFIVFMLAVRNLAICRSENNNLRRSGVTSLLYIQLLLLFPIIGIGFSGDWLKVFYMGSMSFMLIFAYMFNMKKRYILESSSLLLSIIMFAIMMVHIFLKIKDDALFQHLGDYLSSYFLIFNAYAIIIHRYVNLEGVIADAEGKC